MQAAHAIAFANWLAKDQPELFVALYKRALPASKKSLGDFTDILSSIGTSLGNAASSVGEYLTSQQGMQSLTSLASSYLQNRASQSAVQTNLQRAQAGARPAPIQTVYNPNTQQYQAVVAQPNGTVIPLSQTAQSSLLSGMPTWMPYALGAGALVLILLMTRR